MVALTVGAGFACAAAVPAVSPVMWAVLVGMALGPRVRRVPAAAPGVAFAARRLLRAGVVLLGLRISAGDLAQLGAAGLAVAVATVTLTFAFTVRLGRWLRVPSDLALLIAAGTSICGASAIAGMSSVARGRQESVGYALATVTLFGAAAMLLVPVAGAHLGLSSLQTGLWAGASIHEVAQVTAAGAAISPAALEVATLTKLMRVVLLGPAIVVVGALSRDRAARSGGGALRVPGFVLAFVGCVGVRSVAAPSPELLALAADLSTALLAAGLAALGLQVRFGALRDAGWRPLTLGLAAWTVAAVVGLALVVLLAPGS